MTTLTVIFITVLICFELDFFVVLYSKEIGEWLRSKSEELRARAENLRSEHPAYNAGYNAGYTDGEIYGMKKSLHEEDSDLPDRKEGTE